MQIKDIIARIDELKPNKYTAGTKLSWVNQVDGMIWDEIYKYTDFTDVMRQQGETAYDLPVGVKFEQVTNVYLNGKEIYKISHRDFETTGYFRGIDGKLNIYPVPTTDDTTASLRIIHRLSYEPHAADTEEAFMHPPYDKVYDDYIAAMIDKYNQDMDGYNNHTAFYNGGIKEYADWYNDHKQEG